MHVKEVKHERVECAFSAMHTIVYECGCHFSYRVGMLGPAKYGIELIKKKLCETHKHLIIDEQGNVIPGELIVELPEKFLGYKIIEPRINYDVDEKLNVNITELEFKVKYKRTYVHVHLNKHINFSGISYIGEMSKEEREFLELMKKKKEEIAEFFSNIRVYTQSMKF